jgi:hypothetical protein
MGQWWSDGKSVRTSLSIQRMRGDGFNCAEKRQGGKGTVFTCYAVGEELELVGKVDIRP